MTKSVRSSSGLDTESTDVESLLTGGYLSGEDYDAIGARVLDRVAPVRKNRRGRWAAASMVGLSAAAALVLVLSQPDEFTPKGKAAHTGSIEVACNGPSETHCKRGDTLYFIVRSGGAGYLGAYAERVDDPTRSRIWYFPARDGQTVRVDGNHDGRTVASEGIRIGPEHAPGRYRVSAWLSQAPLRHEIVEQATSESLPGLSVHEIEVVP